LSSYAPLAVPDVSWVILSEIDQAEAYAPIVEFERRLVVSAVILMFVVTLLAMVLATSFVRPIRALSEGARRVSDGETDFRIESASRDEFGDLADSFNQMVASMDVQKARAEVTNRENDTLLTHILPKRIVKRLKAGEESIADAHESVTVLFSDLVGFTKLARSVSPKESIAMLNDLVSSFDEAAERLGVEKIKTIGDGYMAASGLSGSRLDHAKRALDLGCDMMRIMHRFNNERGLALELRIGVNSGPLVAGVIGRDKYLYDLWGATVNRANNMKTEAAPGELLVTEAVAVAVKGLYEFEPRGPDAFVLRSGLGAAGAVSGA
jgi:class 3 adenylate cyclase